MKKTPYQFVVGRKDELWIGWIWDEPYLAAYGETKEDIWKALEEKLDKELESRFSPVKKQGREHFEKIPLPPSLDPDELTLRDLPRLMDIAEQRRKLPIEERSLAAWHEENPVKLPDNLLPSDASDTAIASRAEEWLERIATNEIEKAIDCAPDVISYLPRLQRLHQPKPKTPDDIRELFDFQDIRLPTPLQMRRDSFEIRRDDPLDPQRAIVRKECTGLGAGLAELEFGIVASESGKKAICMMELFETDSGLMLTFQKLRNDN